MRMTNSPQFANGFSDFETEKSHVPGNPSVVGKLGQLVTVG